MKAVKATYKNGKITLSEKPAEKGPMEVLVVFPEDADDPWQKILSESTPRASFVKFVKEVEKEIAQGKMPRAKPGRSIWTTYDLPDHGIILEVLSAATERSSTGAKPTVSSR